MKRFVQLRHVRDQVESRMKTGRAECHQSRSQPARRAPAGGGGQGESELLLPKIGELSQAPFQLLDHFRGGAFLRTIDGRGAFRAEQRIGDVAGDQDLHRAQIRRDVLVVDLRHGGHGAADGFQFIPRTIQETISQGRRHADASIGGGAAANAHDDRARSPAQGVQHQLAGAEGGGLQWIFLCFAEPPEAGRGSHFNHGGAAALEETIARLHFAHQGIADPHRHALTMAGGDQGIHRAVSPIRKGNQHQLRIRLRTPSAPGHGFSHGGRIKTFFERIGSKDQLHGLSGNGGFHWGDTRAGFCSSSVFHTSRHGLRLS